MNRDGCSCQLRTDNSSHRLGTVHYCGRAVGAQGYHDYCGHCDGRCGPTNGCQCRACHALDKEIATRKQRIARLTGSTVPVPFVNADGAQCEVSFCPGAGNRHYAAGYKFYCSRTVGREGYFPAHSNCTCDGRCGPGNGCQCRACYELDQMLSSSSTEISMSSLPFYSCTNQDNWKCHLSMDNFHQFRYVHYCGRRVGQQGYRNPCGFCDGRCGPDNGCQCRACHALDDEIASRRRALALSEGLMPAQSPFVNADGVQCNVSYCPPSSHYRGGYKFYCSRTVGREGYFPAHTQCNCDGRCGPNNGCQCRACYELDQMVMDMRRSQIVAQPTPEPTRVPPPPAVVEAPPSSLPAATASAPPTPPTPPTADDLLCIICCEAPKCIAVIPCGHMSMCQSCFNAINVTPNKKCPLCNGNIQNHLKVFI